MADFTPYGSDEKLDRLVGDEYWHYREVAAKQGYGLDRLVNDENEFVRVEVAKKDYGLDRLINDKCWEVRLAVVCQGYGLDKLIDDKDIFVRKVVKKYLKENGYKDIKDWKEKNPDKVYYTDHTDLILAPFGIESLENAKEGDFSSVTQGWVVYEYGWNFIDEEKDRFNYEIDFRVVKGKLELAGAIRVYEYTTTEADFNSEQIKEIESIVQEKYNKEYSKNNKTKGEER